MIDSSLGGVPRGQKMLKGHLPRVIYHQVYYYTQRNKALDIEAAGRTSAESGRGVRAPAPAQRRRHFKGHYNVWVC